MAMPGLSFLLGLLVLAYLSTFVLFALLRLFTGISIQRLGFSSLRRISYTSQNGFKVEIRGLGFQVHRPTFSQPTWISFVISELKFTVDLDKKAARAGDLSGHFSNAHPHGYDRDEKPMEKDDTQTRTTSKGQTERTRTWRGLIRLKEKLKQLHRILPWIRLFDVMAVKSSFIVNGIGAVHVGSLLLTVDTRRHALDRSRLFLHAKSISNEHQPAEWSIGVRSILFEPAGKDSIELMDHCVVNIHGFIYKHLEGLRDASVFIKIGRFHIPYDEIAQSLKLLRAKTSHTQLKKSGKPLSITTPSRSSTDRDKPQDENAILAITEARDFVKSVMRGIREVSFAVSTLGMSTCLNAVRPHGNPVYASMSLKELGLDVYRLDPSTPAQSMYFSRKDVAHQVLLSAISLSVGIDDGKKHPDRLLYVPMTTATIKTTLPSKVLQLAIQESLDLNTNVLFANLVVTSPSVDLDPHHLPIVLAIAKSRKKAPSGIAEHGHRAVTEFLPRASIKLSIQEPVIRVSLPPHAPADPDAFSFDLLISATSSISLDIDSSHSMGQGAQYFLDSNFRLTSHKLYYQTAARQKHDILVNESMELKVQMTADPEVKVLMTASLTTFNVFLLRAEINEGIRQIVRQSRPDTKSSKINPSGTDQPQNPLRDFPKWLQHLQLQGTDFNFEIAGVDKRLSTQPRGCALHVESWTAEYKAQKDDESLRPASRRRRGSVSNRAGDMSPKSMAFSGARKSSLNATDGRRLAIHFRGLDTFVIEMSDTWEQDPFVAIPRAEIAFTTSSDVHGPIVHVNSLVRSVLLQYSLFRFYCLGVAWMMISKTFSQQPSNPSSSPAEAKGQPSWEREPSPHPMRKPDFVVVDFKANFIQLKVRLPDDPPMMLHLHELEVARHRLLHPYAKANVARLYTEAPSVPKAWARIISMKTPRLDLREARRKRSPAQHPERSYDFVCDAIRIGVPHQLIVHKIFDNLVNTAKTMAQLHHRFLTNSDTYILSKKPEGPKYVPKISVRSHVLFFELEDGAFEWKLGVIFRAGLVEQKQRIAREEAFRLKRRNPRGSGRLSSYSNDGLSGPNDQPKSRGNDLDHQTRERGTSNADDNLSRHESETIRKTMRYDSEGAAGFSKETNTSVTEAWERLQMYNARSWKKRVDGAMDIQHHQLAELRSMLWGMDNLPDEDVASETILQIPFRPALMNLVVSDVCINIDRPSFPMEQCSDFMHRLGKGLPLDTKFSLLIPTNVNLEMGECRVSLRDYPLPLLHIPAIKPGQSPRLPSWSAKSDFIIAEEFRDHQSTKDLQIMVVPPEKMDPSQKRGGFAIDVQRTVSPVKTYSDVQVEINTARDTRFTWGVSYQPAIQDMMQVIEGFSKPQVDPSERVGFWDKIRLSFHSRVNVAWKGDGDVHLMLKGLFLRCSQQIVDVTDCYGRFSRPIHCHRIWGWVCHGLAQRRDVEHPTRRRSSQIHDCRQWRLCLGHPRFQPLCSKDHERWGLANASCFTSCDQSQYCMVQESNNEAFWEGSLASWSHF